MRETFERAGSLRGVIVELAEHREPATPERLLPAVRRLRAAGAGIALDDVGGGRGALRYAPALEPDLIKLDGDVVGRIDAEPLKRVMVESALALARDLDTPVVAEGIETAHELDFLLRMGITLGQGFLLARPAVAPGDVSPHVRRWLQARSGRRGRQEGGHPRATRRHRVIAPCPRRLAISAPPFSPGGRRRL